MSKEDFHEQRRPYKPKNLKRQRYDWLLPGIKHSGGSLRTWAANVEGIWLGPVVAEASRTGRWQSQHGSRAISKATGRNRRLKEDNEILKKAAAYFAKTLR